MVEESREAEIKKWQDSLFDAFSYRGVLGGKYLAPAIDVEPKVGAAFVDKYYGHRVLTDSFLDLYQSSVWLTRWGFPNQLQND